MVFLALLDAQGVKQTVPIAKVGVQTVAAGYRASKVIGSIGTHLVVVRYDSLRFDPDNKIVLPGGTKEGLTMLPAFQYPKQ